MAVPNHIWSRDPPPSVLNHGELPVASNLPPCLALSVTAPGVQFDRSENGTLEE